VSARSTVGVVQAYCAACGMDGGVHGHPGDQVAAAEHIAVRLRASASTVPPRRRTTWWTAATISSSPSGSNASGSTRIDGVELGQAVRSQGVAAVQRGPLEHVRPLEIRIHEGHRCVYFEPMMARRWCSQPEPTTIHDGS
jgi:hypothetical protein